ncbi:hypothetical protein MMC25_000145 [Agyrium rufum]|nr:hypothetical protein [Agyrium rufum]
MDRAFGFFGEPAEVSPPGLQNLNHHDEDRLKARCANHLANEGPEDQITGSDSLESEMEETHMQRLSGLNSKLGTLLAKIKKKSSAAIFPRISGGSEATAWPISIALDDSLFVWRPFPSLNLSLQSSGGFSLCKQSRSYASSVFLLDGSIGSPLSDRLFSSTSTTPPSTSNLHPGVKLDSTSLLLILTTYTHFLRLYVVLLAHMCEFLKELSDGDDPYLCPLPGLSFSNFPLQSGDLQTIILIQIITNLIERTERLLGLPREFRINPRGGCPEGLSSDDDFVHVVSWF